MPSIQQTRSRPDIKPIQTHHGHVFKTAIRTPKINTPLSSPAWIETPLSPRSKPVPVLPESQHNGIKDHDRSIVSKLEVRRASSSSDESKGHSAPPSDRRPTISSETRNASVGKLPTESRDEMYDDNAKQLARRVSAPSGSGPAASRYLRFQRFRESLWKQGVRAFGNTSRADAFIVPVDLSRPFRPLAALASTGTVSPSKLTRRLTIRVVIRSNGRAPIALRRSFDFESLRATVPEQLPSPRSPPPGLMTPISAYTPKSLDSFPRNNRSPVLVTSLKPKSSPLPSPEFASPPISGIPELAKNPRALPMHLQYARAQLPVVASIMMSDRVRSGDTIELPVPHPSAWGYTVAYVYTGEEELLSSAVKENILYLGGRV